MADTTTLLPLLPGLSEGVHYPVLVPNMRGLENLLKLEEQHKGRGGGRLTNEIAVFVSATDVSEVLTSYN